MVFFCFLPKLKIICHKCFLLVIILWSIIYACHLRFVLQTDDRLLQSYASTFLVNLL